MADTNNAMLNQMKEMLMMLPEDKKPEMFKQMLETFPEQEETIREWMGDIELPDVPESGAAEGTSYDEYDEDWEAQQESPQDAVIGGQTVAGGSLPKINLASAKPALTCPNCGKELPEGTKFCLNCGAKIEEKKEDAPNTADEPITCSKCGKEIPAGTKFCPSCGTKVKAKPAPKPAPEKPEMVTPANCPKCGNSLPEGTSFCPVCGNKIKLVPKTKAVKDQELEEKIVVPTECPKCGKPLPEGTMFCPGCGTKIVPKKVKPKKQKKIVDVAKESNDDYYSPQLPENADEKYGTSVLEAILKGVGIIGGLGSIVAIVIYFL